MFRTVPLSIISSFSLYKQKWYMSYSLRSAASGRNVLILLIAALSIVSKLHESDIIIGCQQNLKESDRLLPHASRT